MSANPKRILVFSSNLSYSVRKGIVDIDLAIEGLLWLVLFHEPRKRGLRELFVSQLRLLRRNGWRWIPHQIAELLRRAVHTQADENPDLRPGAEYTLAALEARPNLSIVRMDDLHSDASIAVARAFEPHLGLSLAAPILRRALFAVPTLGTINLHKGKLPDFRGMPPAFWELWFDQTSVGCSVHWVDDKLDTGSVVAESSIERTAFSTVRGLQLGLDELGVDLMRAAVVDIFAGDAISRPQSAAEGRTYRKPTLAQAAALERKLRRASPELASVAGRPLKDAISRLAWWSWHLGGRRLLAPRITVLLYHRVSDEARDNLTVGIEQFDRQMELLSRHCHVLTIEEVLSAAAVPKSRRPLVAVTFDDGYLDNHANAAPILRRHGIPAAFFVTTGIVETGGRFPHDLRRGNSPIPIMTWHHLREMRGWGFTIGSHTVGHIDCVAEPEQVVRDELTRSRDDLRRELGVASPIFAYPYGGRQHMNEQRLTLVRGAGYAGCLSAYGGSNVDGVDPFNVLRRPIHWKFSDSALLLSCLGLAR